MNESAFGERTIAARPGYCALCVQALHIDHKEWRLALELAKYTNNQINWDEKISLRLDFGEMAMLYSVLIRHSQLCQFSYRQSELTVYVNRQDDDTVRIQFSYYAKNAGYILLTAHEQLNVYHVLVKALLKHTKMCQTDLVLLLKQYGIG